MIIEDALGISAILFFILSAFFTYGMSIYPLNYIFGIIASICTVVALTRGEKK